MNSTQSTVSLPKKAKGSRPYFFEDPSVDKLMAMLMGLVGELSVLGDRVDALERLLQQSGVLAPGQIDAFSPDSQARVERDARREQLLANVLRVIREVDTSAAGETDDKAYGAIVNLVEQS